MFFPGRFSVTVRSRSCGTSRPPRPASFRMPVCPPPSITDHPVVPIQYLPLCAALAVREGMDEEEALAAITCNPAKICGIDDRVGSLEMGKDADFVVFRESPISFLLSRKWCTSAASAFAKEAYHARNSCI